MIYLKEFAWASASCKVFSANPHIHTHTTHTYPPTPPHTPYTQPLHRHASTERCFHHTEQRRAKRQLGQRGHNLLGNSAAKPRITFGGSLDWKWLSKFISLFCKKKKKKENLRPDEECMKSSSRFFFCRFFFYLSGLTQVSVQKWNSDDIIREIYQSSLTFVKMFL